MMFHMLSNAGFPLSQEQELISPTHSKKDSDKITNMEELFMVCFYFLLPQITQLICSLDFKAAGPLPKGSKEQ